MLNRIYIVVGLIAILALAGAFIAPRFIQWGDYRDRMEMLVAGVFGTDVTIRGDIDFALLPEPRLSFADVVIGAIDQPAATVGSIEARFALMDFLRDRYNLSALVLKRPSIGVELDENGLLVSGIDLSGAGDGVALEQARIEGGRLTLVDRRSGDSHLLSDINGDLRLGSFAGPFQFQGNARHGSEAYSLRFNSGMIDDAGSARLSAFIADALGSIALTFDGTMSAGLAPKFDGTMVLRQAPPLAERADQIRGSLLLESKITASTDRIVLNGYTLLPDENRAGVRLTGAASIQLGARTRFEAVVSGGVFNLPPRDADEDARQMPYELVRLLGELPPPPIPPIPGSVGLDLAEIGLRGAALRNVRIDAVTDGAVWTLSRAEAELPGNSKIGLSGVVRNDAGQVGFNGNLQIATARLDALTQLWRASASDSPLFNIPAQLSGQVMLAGKALGFTHGQMTLNGKVHALELRLGFGDEPRLDLVGRLDELAPGDSAVLAAIFPDPAGDAAFGISFPEGSFSFGSRTIRLFGLEAADMEVSGSWSGSGLRFSRLASSDWGGVTLDATGQFAGTLAAPRLTGSGHVAIADARAPGLTLIHNFLGVPANWRQMFGRSLPAEIDFGLTSGDQPGAQRFTLRGMAGSAKIDVALDMAAGLAGIAKDRVQVVGSIETGDGAGLMRQLGLGDVPLFATDGDMLVSVFAEGSVADNFDARLSASQDGELVAFGGELSVLPGGELAGTGTVELSLTDGSGLAGLAGGGGIAIGGFDASAGVEFFGLQSIAVTGLVGTSADVGFSGELAVEQVAQRPSVQGSLHFDRVPASGLAAALFSAAALVPGEGVWPDGPLAVTRLVRPTRGSIDVTTDALDLGGMLFGDAAFKLNWDAQTLEIADLSASVGGGTLTATLGQCCAGPLLDRTISGRLALDGVDLKAILPPASVSGIAGRLSGGVRFEGSGASLAEAVATLAGEGNLAIADLAVDRLGAGVYPAISALDDVLNMDEEALAILLDQALRGSVFTAPSARGAFSIAGGTARLANMIIDGEGARLAGGLNLTLPRLGLEGSFVLTPLGYADTSGLIEADAARVIARLAGTLNAPEVTIDVSEAVAAVLVRANEIEVDRLEALRLEDEARQRAAAEERNRLIAEQQRRAAEEAAARAAEEAAQKELEAEQNPEPPVPEAMDDIGTMPTAPLDLGYQQGLNPFTGNPLR